MATATLAALKAQGDAKLAEEQRLIERRRSLVVLINDYLVSNGYLGTAERLGSEAGAALAKLEKADNVDLMSVLVEFELYHEFKYGHRPKLVRRQSSSDGSSGGGPDAARRRGGGGSDGLDAAHRRTLRRAEAMAVLDAKLQQGEGGGAPNGSGGGSSGNGGSNSSGGGGRRPGKDVKSGSSAGGSAEGATVDGISGLSLQGSAVVQKDGASGDVVVAAAAAAAAGAAAGAGVPSPPGTAPTWGGGSAVSSDWGLLGPRLLLSGAKPLPAWDPEMRALACTISREILQESTGVRWGDVVGLDEAKRLLQEAVVLPVRFPGLFTGLLTPWCGILLFGPPGTGKTMLARAVASECRTTFFNISASSIVSKYRGDSEKLVRVLFELARHHAPSTIFIDEIDSIMGQRGGGGGGGGGGVGGGEEHEGSRRMKTELLIQMDGLAKTQALVFVLAASNLPWELDTALLRRLEKRVFVRLPRECAREVMLRKHLEGRTAAAAAAGGAERVDFAAAVQQTEGYSGADIRLLCKEAAMKPVRRIMAQLDAAEVTARTAPPPPQLTHQPHGIHGARGGGASNGNGGSGRVAGRWTAGVAAAPSAEDVEKALQADPVTAADLAEALRHVKPAAPRYSDRYAKWEEEFGST